MTRQLLPALLLALFSVPATAHVTVSQASYRGWTNAYRLSNGTVDVVIIPSIGRIMAFALTGHPATSPLYNNPAELGHLPKAAPGAYPSDWDNYGGDKVWPSQQSDWPQHQPKAWPPDPSFDHGPYTVTRLRDGLRLTSPVSPYYQIKVIRDIILPPHGAQVTIRDTFIKSRGAAGKQNGFPVGIWSISQVRGDATVYLPLNKHGLFPGVGLTSLGDKPEMRPNWYVEGNTVAVTRIRGQATKMGLDDGAGWMACLLDRGVLFTEHFTRDPHVRYPDKGCNAEVYTGGDESVPYIEMEALGPLASLRAGHRLTYAMSWRLQRLPRRPRGDADARRLVLAASH